MTKIIYISGKITGDPNYKAKFKAVADKYESQGHTVFNPAILPEDSRITYTQYMAICFAMLECCDTLILLSDWKDSIGARAEYIKAVNNDLEVIEEEV